MTHLFSLCFRTAFISSSWSMLSNIPIMSYSINHAISQHRSLTAPTASIAERFGRYPYESVQNIGSTNGSKFISTTICATLSAIVGIPSNLFFPFFFGISTPFTADGK
jgi:hypothetical protein